MTVDEPRTPTQTTPTQTLASDLVFSTFYEEHHESIARALTLTLSDRELAIDATNEAMTRALQRWTKISRHANPAGWVYRVGLNWALSWLRRRRRERDRPILFTAPTTELTITDFALADAIEHLSTEHRAVVICRFYLDWSVEQTAAGLDIAPGTVKSRLARALKKLRHHMEPASTSTSAQDAS